MERSELDDFYSFIRAYNLCKDDFEIKEVRCDKHTSTHEFLPQSQLTITYLPTNVSRTYVSGHLSRWLTDFQADLKSGAFNS